jgi:hypothetical protein
MSDGTLEIDPVVLRSAATSFGQTAEQLGSLHADEPLTDAAAAVTSLQTAAACRTAESAVAAEVAAVSDAARQFGEILGPPRAGTRRAMWPPPTRSRRSVVHEPPTVRNRPVRPVTRESVPTRSIDARFRRTTTSEGWWGAS